MNSKHKDDQLFAYYLKLDHVLNNFSILSQSPNTKMWSPAPK